MAAPARWSSARAFCAWAALLAGLAPPGLALHTAAAVLLASTVLLSWSSLRAIPRVLMLLVGVSAVTAAVQAPAALAPALTNTTQIGALVVAVLLLSGTLGASRDVQIMSGNLLSSGRPLARYLGVAFVTGVLAVPLNFGAVAVMSALVSRLKEQGDTALARNAARSVLRGFALASVCSPLSFSIVLTLTLLPGLRLLELISATAPFAVAFIMAGAAFREPEPQSESLAELRDPNESAVGHASSTFVPAPPPMRTPAPTGTAAFASALTPAWPAWLRFASTIGAICTGAYVASHWGGLNYARAVAMSCVVAAAIGLLIRAWQRAPLQVPALGHIGNELAVLAGSAFLGVLAGRAGATLLGPDFGLPVAASPLVAFIVPWLLFVGGAAGLNPIVTGTLVGALLGPIWPPNAELGLGVAIVCGWGLTTAGTPWSANSLLLSRLTGYDAKTAAWNWNLKLSLSALTLAGLFAATLTWLRTTT